jgi:beta-lactamase regulating signal transducer with metallopeptidase domain
MALEYVGEILIPRLFAASVQSALLVALVWTLCRLLPRLPATARCWLWWLVALQLVVGLLWADPLALPLLPADPQAQAALIRVPPLVAAASPGGNAAASLLPAVSQAASVSPALVAQPAAWSWPLAFSVLWLLGLSVMITRTLLGYLSTRRLLRESTPCRDASLIQALRLAAEAHGLRAVPELRLSSAIASPQLIGPWSPVLMLPAQRMPSLDADELDMALTHELTHLQRGDLWWGLLPALAQHLFFFHPLAHLAAREYAFAREAACDAAVLAGNPHCAGDYGRLLVRLGVAARPSAGLASASPTFLMLKRRLLMLQQNTSPLRASALALTIAVALFGVVPYRVTAAAQPSAPAPGPAPSASALANPMPVPMAVPGAMSSSQTIADSRILPAPPAPPLPPRAPSAPSAATAAAPAAPAAPSAPPKPPAPPLVSKGVWAHSKGDYAHVLIDGDTTHALGASEDLRAAKSQQRNGEPLLWIRKGANQYVVRDTATIRRLQAAYAPVTELGEEQARLGAKQAELGGQQGRLGARQGQLGTQQAEIAERHAAAVVRQTGAESDARNQAEAAATEQRIAALGQQQEQLGREQQALGEKQHELGRQQQALSERQQAATEAAQRETERLIETAVANGQAQRVK